LKECIATLPEKSLQMMRSRYEDDLSAQDIAEQYGMKPPAVRKALERVRTSLRKCMEDRLGLAGA